MERNNFLFRLGEKSAVWWIAALSAIFYLIEIIIFGINGDNIAYIALSASNFLSGKYLWTIITHIFAHGSLLHLFVNMFALISIGGICERIIGRKRFTWLYLLSGVFAGLLSVSLAGFFGFGFWERVFGSPEVYMLGASGAIFAVAGLFVVLVPKARFSIIFFPFFSMPGYILVPSMLILMWAASIFAGLPIGNVAHFGGFIAGAAYGFYLRKKYRRKIEMLQRYFK